jgi:hypothetical protein
MFAPPEDPTCMKSYIEKLNTVLDLDHLERYVIGEEKELDEALDEDKKNRKLISKVTSKIRNRLREAGFPAFSYDLEVLFPGDTLWFLASTPHAGLNVGKWTMCLLHNTYTKRYFPRHVEEIIAVGGEGTPKSEKAVETWADILYVRTDKIVQEVPELKDKVENTSKFSSLAKLEQKQNSQKRKYQRKTDDKKPKKSRR